MLPLKPYNEYLEFTRPVGIDGLAWPMTILYRHQQGFRQRHPYDIDTVYTLEEVRHIAGPYSSPRAWSWDLLDSRQKTDATNKARARFVAALGDVSSFGATATAELKTTWNSVVSVITRLAGAARAVSRLRFFDAAKLLGLPYSERIKKKTQYRTVYISRKNGLGRLKTRTREVTNEVVFSYGTGREYLKTLANGWLMWSYGAKPLVSDIYNGMDALQRPFPTERFKGYGRADYRDQYPKGSGADYLYSGSVKVTVAADVRVNNPNLWICNQMGLVNPVQWFNEGIPFSFVVDWFSNLSAVIMQMTDFVGLDVLKPCTCSKYTMIEAKISDPKWGGTKQRIVFIRDLSIPSVKFTMGYERFEWQRGLNAISLLVGFLPRR